MLMGKLLWTAYTQQRSDRGYDVECEYLEISKLENLAFSIEMVTV